MKEKKFQKEIGKKQEREVVGSSQARGPCQECGQIAVGPVWKGGGYNMSSGPAPTSAPTHQKADGPGSGVGKSEENYIKSLQQQIKILELEVAYLKKHGSKLEQTNLQPKEQHEKTDKKKQLQDDNDELVKAKQELQVTLTKSEQIRMEKDRLDERLKQQESQKGEDRNKFQDKV